MAVKKGDKVKVEYTGTLEDGKVFDSSKTHGTLLEFEVGSGQIIKGFDTAMIGMKKGESKKIKIPAAEAYGNPDPRMIKQVPRAQLPESDKLKEGMMLGVGLPNGQRIPAKITKVAEKDVTIDLNHPLAGKTLNFEIKLVEIVK